MAENNNNKERMLFGERTLTPSSDEAIKARLDEVTSGVYGVNPTEVTDAQVITTQSLPERIVDQVPNEIPVRPVLGATKLNAKDSAPWNNLVSFRSKRKAA